MRYIKRSKSPSAFFTLLALAISAFAIGTTEFVMAGVLPELAQSLAVSIPVAGWLMTGYAAGVFISAPILTAATIRLSRKYILVGLMSLFILGNVISAIAPKYGILMMGRIIAALCHGAFFGIGAVVAADAVPPNKRAHAIALMFTGLTVANVVGVPMGTLLAQHFGWRSMFWVISSLGAISMVSIMALVPYHKVVTQRHFLHELAMFKRPQVWRSLFVTALGFGGVFASFAYIAPIMVNVAGFAESSMVWLLLLFGISIVIGNLLGGKAADRALKPTLYFGLILLAIVLFTFVFTAHFKVLAVISLFLLGVIGFIIVSPVQAQAMQHAKDAPTLASAANISSFNLGIAIGTYLAGLAIHLGFGYTSANWVGGILVVIALIIQSINARTVE
jgi:DHA1 family inner membrane transport protein